MLIPAHFRTRPKCRSNEVSAFSQSFGLRGRTLLTLLYHRRRSSKHLPALRLTRQPLWSLHLEWTSLNRETPSPSMEKAVMHLGSVWGRLLQAMARPHSLQRTSCSPFCTRILAIFERGKAVSRQESGTPLPAHW